LIYLAYDNSAGPKLKPLKRSATSCANFLNKLRPTTRLKNRSSSLKPSVATDKVGKYVRKKGGDGLQSVTLLLSRAGALDVPAFPSAACWMLAVGKLRVITVRKYRMRGLR
jgi:hypothetical protein